MDFAWLPVVVVLVLGFMVRSHIKTALAIDRELIAKTDPALLTEAAGEKHLQTATGKKDSFINDLVTSGLIGLGILVVFFGLFMMLGGILMLIEEDSDALYAIVISVGILGVGAWVISRGVKYRTGE